MNEATKTRGARRAGAILLAACAAWTTIGIYAVHAIMPYNPIKLPGEKAVEVGAWAPEGWKFFTRSPLEERALAFHATDAGDFAPVPHVTYSSPSNLFGASRRARVVGLEMGTLLEQVSDTQWTKCDDAPAKCLERATVVATVKNGAPHPTMCGSIGIALQKPVPWAWARASRPVTMPSRVARVVVQC